MINRFPGPIVNIKIDNNNQVFYPRDINISNFNTEFLLSLAHSPIFNYGMPGVSSWLIGTPSKMGCVRLFVSESDHEQVITPHSHRFDFHSIVLHGSVENIMWNQTNKLYEDHVNLYQISKLNYNGDPGKYTQEKCAVSGYKAERKIYNEGDTYSMRSHEIHSIKFSKDALVLFFEGPTLSNVSYILEPIANGECIKTFKVEDYMFLKGNIGLTYEMFDKNRKSYIDKLLK